MNKILEASAITIIGGADGSTSIYVSSGAKWQLILILLIFIFYFYFWNYKINSKYKKA